MMLAKTEALNATRVALAVRTMTADMSSISGVNKWDCVGRHVRVLFPGKVPYETTQLLIEQVGHENSRVERRCIL